MNADHYHSVAIVSPASPRTTLATKHDEDEDKDVLYHSCIKAYPLSLPLPACILQQKNDITCDQSVFVLYPLLYLCLY